MSESERIETRQEKIDTALNAIEMICEKLRKPGETASELKAAAGELDRLRRLRAYPEMAQAAEAIRRQAPSDILISTLQAQALIEEGHCAAAADLMDRAVERATPGTPAWQEAFGLLGRANKQIYIDEPDRSSDGAREALRRSVAAYHTAFATDPAANYWHGGNAAALLFQAEQIGEKLELDRGEVAARLVAGLDMAPAEARSHWWRGTYAEAELARGDYDAAAEHITAFLRAKPDPHALNSFQRQLATLWGFEQAKFGTESKLALEMLRARLLKIDGERGNPSSPILVSVDEVAPLAKLSGAERQHAERTFGDASPQELVWWRCGNVRAQSVGAVLGPVTGGAWKRHGTGFLVPLIEADGSAGVGFLTNGHVVGDLQAGGLEPKHVNVRFEARSQTKRYAVTLLWTSPYRQFDATLLRIEGLPNALKPLPLSRAMPALGSETRLYIIGHPDGQELSFSFQDNKFLDWADVDDRDEKPVTLIHYRTPTHGGSSGSPVFQELDWRAIALHHAGHHFMPKLHDRGVYEANEGVGLGSISDAMNADTGIQLSLQEH